VLTVIHQPFARQPVATNDNAVRLLAVFGSTDFGVRAKLHQNKRHLRPDSSVDVFRLN